MTDKQYLKIMRYLGEELEKVCDTEPYSLEAHQKVIKAIVSTNRTWWHSRQRRRMYLSVLCWVLFCILVGYVIYILAVP